DWPGNIRELENTIEHAFIWEESSRIQMSSLPEPLLLQAGVELSQISMPEPTSVNAEVDTGRVEPEESSEMVTIQGEALDFNKHKEAFEKEFIIKALKTFKGRINQTALHANIPKKTLLRKIEKYGINAKDYIESNP
ncbi:MAG: sigma-54-dependent Fis family transcriptional regulator, partial [Bdellovibrionales bacterium]|nr:sigma-54-dependent Fis family transcriptional regulator [Bdellovibrionales bacterium]